MFDLTRPPTAQMYPRAEKLAHNARWHLLDFDGVHRKVGWGDLALTDLHQVRAQLHGRLFVAVREDADDDPLSGRRWGNYHEQSAPDPTLTAADDAVAALFVVTVEAGVLARIGAAEPARALTSVPGTRPITTPGLTHLISAHWRPPLRRATQPSRP